jgi:hypothetical protein
MKDEKMKTSTKKEIRDGLLGSALIVVAALLVIYIIITI